MKNGSLAMVIHSIAIKTATPVGNSCIQAKYEQLDEVVVIESMIKGRMGKNSPNISIILFGRVGAIWASAWWVMQLIIR